MVVTANRQGCGPPSAPATAAPAPKPPPAPPASAPAPAATSVAPTVAVVSPAAPRDQSPGRTWKTTAGWTAVGVGGASLVAGMVLGVMARNKQSEFDEGAAVMAWEDLEPIDRAGKRLQQGQIVTLATGGVVLVAGAGLFLWDMLTGRGGRAVTGASVAPLFTGRGGGVAAQVSF